jgi:hypothetical protein
MLGSNGATFSLGMAVGVGLGVLAVEDVPVLAAQPITAYTIVTITSAASTRERSFIDDNLIRSGATFVSTRFD